MLTKTEAARRLRKAAAAARANDWRLTMNMRVEVGLRTVPVYAETAAAAKADPFHPDDDLRNCGSINEVVRYYPDEVCRPGYIAHLYFSTTGDWGELVDVVTVWTGYTADDDPEVLHS